MLMVGMCISTERWQMLSFEFLLARKRIMKSLICKQPYHFEYQNIDAPVLKPNHAIIKIKHIGICGTDLHAFEGTQPYFSYPRILGHELSGDLIDFDNADDFVPGDV